MSTTAELKSQMKDALAKATAIKNQHQGTPPAAALAEMEAHMKDFEALRVQHDAQDASDKVKEQLKAIGLELGLDGPEFEPRSLIKAAGSYKRAAAVQWGMGARNAIQKHLAAMGLKSLQSGADIAVPEIISGPVNLPEERRTILHLIASRTIDGQTLDGPGGSTFGFKRQVTRTNNAAAVPSGALKPTSVYEWESQADRVRTIAHLSQPQPNWMLEDFDALQDLLIDEMGSGLQDEVERQVLVGTGTISPTPAVTEANEELPGILNTSGIRAQDWNTDLLTTLSAAWDVMEVANENPNAWVLRTEDYRKLKNMREAGSTGALMFHSGRSSIEQILGEIPVIVSNLLPAGTALLGDFRKAQLIQRGAATFKRNEGDTSLFDYNLTKFRAEGRFGLAVLRPAAFMHVDTVAA